MRVLIVSGSMDQARELRNLYGPGHEVWNATGAKSSEQLFRTFRPDAVVMFLSDLSPDHRARIAFFRSHQGNRSCAVLAVAPFTHLKLVQQVLDWGVDAYLASPCTLRRVKNRLEELCGKAGGDLASAGR